MSNFDEPPKPHPANEINGPKGSDDIPGESHFEETPHFELEQNIENQVLNGKWHDNHTIELFQKWKDDIIQSLYEASNFSDSEVSDAYQNISQNFFNALKLKIQSQEERDKFENFLEEKNYFL